MQATVEQAKAQTIALAKEALEFAQQNKKLFVHIIGITLIVIILGSMLSYVSIKMRLLKTNCNNLTGIPSAVNLNSSWITSADPVNQHPIRDFYIKTAYNCCSTGAFSNDYVGTCALEYVIKQGCRCLDFEIYGLSAGEPIISSSVIDDRCLKETYNSVAFDDAMKIISICAFNTDPSKCPNPSDPLLLHFRIKTNNVATLNSMADSIKTHLESRMLPIDYGHENDGYNLCVTKVSEFLGKVIIIVQSTPLLYQNASTDANATANASADAAANNNSKNRLFEITNLTSNSAFARCLTNFNVINSPDITELIEYNKQKMTVVLPDDDSNYNPIPPSLAGCQCIAMCFQYYSDGNLAIYNAMFDKGPNNSAFLLKPQNMWFVPQTINVPAPQDPKLTFASRDLTSPMYKFTV